MREPLRSSCALTLREVAEATRSELPPSLNALVIGGVATDTRDLVPGDLFVARKGVAQDGHRFISAAVSAGAVAILMEDAHEGSPAVPALLVPDTTRALGQLARHWRRRLGIKLVAVTGSNGKTTTKEMIAAILASHTGSRESVLVTPGNFNNHVGLPLTLLKGTVAQRLGVVELGMNAPGEIAALTAIAEPQVGLVTNAAEAHLERFGGDVGEVALAKAELWESMGEDAVAVVNLDDPRLPGLASRRRGPRLTFGRAEGADVRVLSADPAGDEALAVRLMHFGSPLELQIPLLGRHQAFNAAAAAAAAHALGVAPEKIREGLLEVRLPEHRAVVTAVGQIVVLDDCYNANPASVRAAASALKDLEGSGRLGALLGELRELGPGSAPLHRELGRHLGHEGFGVVIGLGPLCEALCQGAVEGGVVEVVHVHTVEEAAAVANERFSPGDRVLVKGSRAMGMEAAINAWRSLAAERGGA
ncbi:MAG: UDP-N-acetylmuramoyl-tripeptide--D-alanyl-D-alanine ligase [Polyangia bacterium]|nr:UDP-N-acetylmuramoyl-tripeptide--D-alanyl-D-alanine ligase [Polyangia bacterium]